VLVNISEMRLTNFLIMFLRAESEEEKLLTYANRMICNHCLTSTFFGKCSFSWKAMPQFYERRI